ncbi:o-succinylbenzoate--CoA ligase [Dermacoccaceae bacterium W4C1]
MPDLRSFPVHPDRLPLYLQALTEMIEGTGPALLPYAADAPTPNLSPEDLAKLPEDAGLVMSTSGSTGTPKRAVLTRGALTASARATHQRLGGDGQWVLAMPAHHIAGTQVLLRSIVVRRSPVLVAGSGSFDPLDLADALAWSPPGRRYTSLVPTQLRIALDHEAGVAALAQFDGILIGGASCPPQLLHKAREAGLPVVTTYGMSETAGGCVYDGEPLPDTRVHLGDDGRIALSGPSVAHGYLGDPERTAAAFDLDPETGHRRFWTDDLGEFVQGRLRVLGRRDDVIVTGGLKIAPRVVEEAALTLPPIREAVVVGTPHPKWGQAVSLAVVADDEIDLGEVRDQLRSALEASALPTRLLILRSLPTRGPGKPDRGAIAALTGWQNHG